ncbi:MAG: TonB-dependent receptor plug domain-containing protein, partial [Megasphaera sp.]|nr:TonB-dependent receptor plug domain-containing protein [Megasphaera sp.]
MNYRNYTALLAVLMTTSWYGTIQAADAGTEEPVQLKDVVVTATKTEEEVKAVPQAVEVWTHDDLERMGAANVRSALQLANNVSLAKAGMTGNAVMIRGMSTNHSLILVDGKRYAAEDTDVTTNVYALERLDLSDIERIEIVRGPSSSLYGSDAMGGVIN